MESVEYQTVINAIEVLTKLLELQYYNIKLGYSCNQELTEVAEDKLIQLITDL